MIDLVNILLLILSYLIGSVPTAVWIGKAFYDIDVREHGSGNAGATNTFRVLGKKAGIPVLLIDVIKGWAGVALACYSHYASGSVSFVNFQLMLGVAALLGHIFPIYAGFRGGKGIATLLGIVVALHPMAALCSAAVFLIVFLTFNYVSLGSMFAAVSFPFWVIWLFKNQVSSLTIFSIGVAVLVLFTHQKNIQRLLKGEESKIYLFKSKSK